jgi:hypothetical protein
LNCEVQLSYYRSYGESLMRKRLCTKLIDKKGSCENIAGVVRRD